MNNTPSNSSLYKEDPLVQSLSSLFALISHSVNFCLGIPLNLYIIVLILRSGGLDGSAFYKLNQAVTEIVFSTQTPLFILCFTDRSLCFPQAITFIGCLCLCTRFIFQCCVCFEHYLAVVQPVTFLKYKSRKWHLAIVTGMWNNALVCAIVGAVNASEMLYTAFGVMLIIILNVHLFFVFSILRVLRRPGPGEKTNKDGGMKMKALKLVSFSLLAFLVQYIPMTVLFTLQNLMSRGVFFLVFIININISNASGIVQPILFLRQTGKVTFAQCKCEWQ